jgi:hypothetical protein
MRSTGDAKKANSRNEYWRNLIDQQAGSGQSVHVFCSERRLTEQSFYCWRKRLSKEAPVSFALVAAHGSSPNRESPLELDLGSGQRLRIPCGVDAETLRTVLTVLRERA